MTTQDTERLKVDAYESSRRQAAITKPDLSADLASMRIDRRDDMRVIRAVIAVAGIGMCVILVFMLVAAIHFVIKAW